MGKSLRVGKCGGVDNFGGNRLKYFMASAVVSPPGTFRTILSRRTGGRKITISEKQVSALGF
jgi:hypothetical protein